MTKALRLGNGFVDVVVSCEITCGSHPTVLVTESGTKSWSRSTPLRSAPYPSPCWAQDLGPGRLHGQARAMLVAPGQGGDTPMFTHLMHHLKFSRTGPGTPRTHSDRVRGDKAHSSDAIRTRLRDRGMVAVIPQPSDQIGHRRRRGSSGGRPPSFDKEAYKGRNMVKRNFNTFKQWRALAPRYDKLAFTFRSGALHRATSIQPTALGDMH